MAADADAVCGELEDSELALIEAARDGGATWTRIAAALGARNRQTAQKRHADSPAAARVHHQWTRRQRNRDRRPGRQARRQQPPPSKSAGERRRSPEEHDPGGRPCQAAASARAARPRPRPPAIPRITDAIIAEGLYELVRHPTTQRPVPGTSWSAAGSRDWSAHWHGERSRPGWEPVDTAGIALPATGIALPATGIGRTTPAGNARTRDAAAVSLLRAIR